MTYGSDLQVNIPPELRDPTKRRRVSLQGYLNRLRQGNPLELYLNQLADYFFEQEQAGKITKNEATAEYDRIEKQAQTWSKIWPINTLPLYEQVSQITEGPHIMESYEDWSDELEDEIATLKLGAGTPKGRQELELEVQKGTLTFDEAFAENPVWMDYVQASTREKEQKDKKELAAQQKEQDRIAKQREAQIRGLQDPQTAKAQNWIDYQNALAANPETAGMAELGFNEQRARDLVEEERRATTPGNIQGAPAFDNLEGILQMVQSQGIDTSAYQNELKTLSQRAQAGQANQELVNAAVLQMVQRINQDATGRQRTQNQFESDMLAKQFPDAYAGWKNKPENSNAYFSQWAKNDTPFQQLKRAQEETNLRKYGDIYDAYSDFTGGLKSADEYKPIDQWIQETPRAKIAWEERQRRQMLKDASLPLPAVRYVRNR